MLAANPGVFTNRPDYTQSFNGLELTLNKRLSSGWMMRANFAYNNTKQHVGKGACVDPTNMALQRRWKTRSPEFARTADSWRRTPAAGAAPSARST